MLPFLASAFWVDELCIVLLLHLSQLTHLILHHPKFYIINVDHCFKKGKTTTRRNEHPNISLPSLRLIYSSFTPCYDSMFFML